MHYSFRNTLCGLAVVIAAGLLADQAAAQTVTLLEDDDTISLVAGRRRVIRTGRNFPVRRTDG